MPICILQFRKGERYYGHSKTKNTGEQINISFGPLLIEMVVPVIPDILKILVGFRCEFNSFHQQVPDPFAQTLQSQFFFASISCSMALSRLRSATNFFNLRLSSSSCRMCFSSEGEIPLYFLRHVMGWTTSSRCG